MTDLFQQIQSSAGDDPPCPVRASSIEPEQSSGGFTLLEVMVALAILALSFTALLGTQSSSVVLSRYINDMSVATLLARGKMLDIEHKLKKDGFAAFSDETMNGDFSTEGHPEMKWEAAIEKIEVDESSIQGMMDGAPQTKDDILNKLQENPALSSIQGLDLSGLNFNPGMIFGFMPTAIQILGDKVRKCTLTVSWKDGKRTRTLPLQTYFVQFEELIVPGNQPDPADTTPPSGAPPVPQPNMEAK